VHVIDLVLGVFAVWRLTEIITVDRIFDPVRKRWPIYFLSCPRCVSVWVAMAVTMAYVKAPYLIWPFGLSGIYILASQAWARFLNEIPEGALLVQTGNQGAVEIRGRNMNRAQISKILLDAYNLVMKGAA
jgi:hypothetical protein